MGISERAVREIERRAFKKIRRALGAFWHEYQTGIKEAWTVPSAEWPLKQAEIAAVFALARTTEERLALRKLLALTGSL